MSYEPIQPEGPRRMLTIAKVLEIVPVSRTTLYRMVVAKTFPPSLRITAQVRVWYEDEIVEWQKTLPVRRLRQPRLGVAQKIPPHK
jgi:predicted DNA-binding transcriptional regulator AlpA